ncbi:MAG: hypothetical protein HQL09_04870 [Nitrospirae bacterium]|nr:hypothetical protein [Nitrospirota bacterium]
MRRTGFKHRDADEKKEVRNSLSGSILCFGRSIVPALLSLFVCFYASAAWAGPPFVTDDPEPVEYKHGEFYVASVTNHNGDATSGTLPHFELNYGPLPDVHLHLITPFAYNKPRGHSMQWGYGDTELGVKYRFIHETEIIPQVGTFPVVELPSGDSTNGLGERRVRFLIPIWVQKSWGPWTVYGGGGYWHNPGPDNRNYWQTGGVVMRELSKVILVGAEVFNFTAKAKGNESETGFNIGAIINVTDDHHILFSAGRDFHGTNMNTFNAYVAYQFTFGPHEEKKEEEKK